MMYKYLLLFFLLPSVIFAQKSIVQLQPQSFQKLMDEDKRVYGNSRFAAPVDVNINPAIDGIWETKGNTKVWTIKFSAPNALHISLLYKNFRIPDGATLVIFNKDKSEKYGPYTSKFNNQKGNFITSMISGDEAIIEYTTPIVNANIPPFTIWRVYYGYREKPESNTIINQQDNTERFIDTTLGFGKSNPCNININCPLGANYQNNKRGVARIFLVMDQGLTGYCTGSLVNNTNNDGEPLFLSAFHCQDGFTPLWDYWVFDFNYESNNCSNPAQEPSTNFIVGATPLAGRQQTDFLLMRLNVLYLPPSYKLYLNGWSIDTTVGITKSALIHHPKGDIQKISVDNDPAVNHSGTITWNNNIVTAPYTHWKMILDQGIFEIGSSGGPLFNQNGQIIGQLHGGNVNVCSVINLFAGKLSKSWVGDGTPSTRLKDWLDPNNTGIKTISGYDPPDTLKNYTLAGYIINDVGKGVKDIEVKMVSDSTTLYAYTDTLGLYVFPLVPSRFTFEMTCNHDTLPNNGVSTADLVAINKHILKIDTLNTPLRIIAADANNDNKVSTADMVELRKLILLIIEKFSNSKSWRFMPTVYQFPDEYKPFPFPEKATITNPTGDYIQLDWYGMKVGDVNNSKK